MFRTMPTAPIPLFPRLLSAIVVLIGLYAAPSAAPAAAQSANDAAAFRGVISAQVKAFRADAWEDAFSFASPKIRRMFGTAESFRSLVMGGYEAVARPEVFEFEDATVIDGKPTQPVFVVGPDGVAKRALYFMEKQPDGSWKIDGVVLETLPDRTT